MKISALYKKEKNINSVGKYLSNAYHVAGTLKVFKIEANQPMKK